MSAAVENAVPIGELSRRTGLSVETIRAWERRHGFPVPQRLPGGHRRYAEADVERVLAVVRERERGLSVPAAIAQVAGTVVPPADSLFGAIRRARPELQVQQLHKRLVTALSFAIEDECVAWADRPLLVGAFQEERFYRQSQARWKDISANAQLAVALARFETARADRRPAELPLRASSQMIREWAIVCSASDHAAFLSGWELPGQGAVPDPQREFEVIWSVDPEAVGAAARAAIAIIRDSDDDLAAAAEELIGDHPMPSVAAQATLGGAITTRMLARL